MATLANDKDASVGSVWLRHARAVFFSALIGSLVACSLALGQTATSSKVPPSELERHNMSRVAARPSQLVAIFYRDPGLLVTLKRWMARDATDHGQLISDSDLTDEA